MHRSSPILLLILALAIHSNGSVNAASPSTFGSAYSMILLPPGQDTVLWDYKTTTYSVLSYFWWTASFDAPNNCKSDIIFSVTVDGDNKPLIISSKTLSGEDFLTNKTWGHEHFGKGSTLGAVYTTMRIPFTKRLLITGRPTSCVRGPATVWWIGRGIKNQVPFIGGVPLPVSARLRQSTIEKQKFKRLEFVNLVTTNKAGAIWHTFFQMIETTSPNWIEGCFRMYNQNQNATVLGTGFEDYFQSSFTFAGGEFQFSEAGCLHGCFGNSLALSAYKVHDKDALFFDAGGLRYTWRVGDVTNSIGQKCYETGTPAGDPHDSVISVNVWWYEW